MTPLPPATPSPTPAPARVDHAESGASAAQNPGFRMINTRKRDEEDAAAVIAILTALAAAGGDPEPEPATRSVWGDPEHRLGLAPASPVGWWASGLAR